MMHIHKKDVTDAEIEMAMKPVFEELSRFLVPRVKRESQPQTRPAEKRPGNDSKAIDANEAIAQQELDLLKSIYASPNLSITARSARLGLSANTMNGLKAAVIRRKFAEQFSINLGKEFGGNVVLLALTDAGYKAIGKSQGIKKPVANVGHEHWYWQNAICEHYLRKGIDAEIEKSKGGKRADIGIVWKEKEIAIEVELSPKM